MLLAGSWKHCSPHNCARTCPRAHVQVRAQLFCPYTTLGVNPTANEREIKKAYRQLALKYHPDVSSLPDAHVKFLTIQQAYDLLTGKARGKEIDVTRATGSSSSNGWDFHDWFWQFKSSRRWDPHGTKQQQQQQHSATGAAGFQAGPENQENLRSQLAGLRHRAAVRATRRHSSAAPEAADSPAAAAAGTAQTSQQQQQQQLQHDPEPTWVSSDIADGAQVGSSSHAHGSGPGDNWSAGTARRFVPSGEQRADVTGQLAGLRRKSAIRQQQSA